MRYVYVMITAAVTSMVLSMVFSCFTERKLRSERDRLKAELVEEYETRLNSLSNRVKLLELIIKVNAGRLPDGPGGAGGY